MPNKPPKLPPKLPAIGWAGFEKKLARRRRPQPPPHTLSVAAGAIAKHRRDHRCLKHHH